MRLVRLTRPNTWFSPFERLSTLREDLDRFLEGPLSEWSRPSEFFTGWAPPLDVYEDKDRILVRSELSGLRKEEIELSLQDGKLTLGGERKSEKQVTGKTTRTERVYGRFQRTVTLPSPVDAAHVTATYQDGVLTVTLPKTEEAKPRQIDVKVA